MQNIKSWEEIVEKAGEFVIDKPQIYKDRLKFEIYEIEKQGAERYWLELVTDGASFEKNPNRLLLPYLLNIVAEDPISTDHSDIMTSISANDVLKYKDKNNGKMPTGIYRDSDMPDIDIDCLPGARDHLKEYVISKYGQKSEDSYGSVCSVGTWQTYKFKSAIIDVSVALGIMSRFDAERTTTQLPEHADDLPENGISVCRGKFLKEGVETECGTIHGEAVCPSCKQSVTDAPTIGQLIEELPVLKDFATKNPEIIASAIKLVGRIRNMGMHAGALLITDRALFGNIPMAKSSNKGYWVSMWTEGRSTQLSKFGYVKWDWLGLKTLEYIFRCCEMVKFNRDINFGENLSGWEDIDPKQRKAGFFIDASGVKHIISLDDDGALKLANTQKCDGIFQFDTELAMSLLAHGVRNFEDLMLINAMGHPGPIAALPETMANRDDPTMAWKKRMHPEVYNILKETYGQLVYQEQLTQLWQRLAGFTAPEAQETRKAVAKKWTHKLRSVEQKWVAGASKTIGEDEARAIWSKMVSFGRYAFNKSHSVAYCLVTLRCLFLKAHFAPEFWASVMNDCHPDKLVRYMGVARSEEWKPTAITKLGSSRSDDPLRFEAIDINNLSLKFIVKDNTIFVGVSSIKGFGEKIAECLITTHKYASMDDFILKTGIKSKTVLERLIKLGAFRNLERHNNSKALWVYYQTKYGNGPEAKETKNFISHLIISKQGWNEGSIAAERERLVSEYRIIYPKKKAIPKKLLNWKPEPIIDFCAVLGAIGDDFSFEERLEFQNEYLGYYIDSPLGLFYSRGDLTIAAAKSNAKSGQDIIAIEGIIVNIEYATSKNNKPYAKISASDGMLKTSIMVWSKELSGLDKTKLVIGAGIRVIVDYDGERNSFSLRRNTSINILKRKQINAAADERRD